MLRYGRLLWPLGHHPRRRPEQLLLSQFFRAYDIYFSPGGKCTLLNNMIFGRTLHTVQKSVVKGLAVMYITVGQKNQKSPGQKNS